MIEVGDHAASSVYVRNKIKACAEVGLHSAHVELPASTTEADLLGRVAQLNADPAIHGILVQLPLPRHIAAARILEAIAPAKDVDGFHPVNVGLLTAGEPRFVPCTPAGVLAMLEAEGVEPLGQTRGGGRAQATSWASRSPCSYCSAAQPSPSATPRPRTSLPIPRVRTSSSSRWAGRNW